MAEFTGERVIPGQVDVDLLNEHMARYAFAARLARGKRVLDAGCGAGYGSAELARAAQTRGGHRLAAGRHRVRARALSAAESDASSRLRARRCRIADGSFDLIVAFEVIEHLDDWRGSCRKRAACSRRTASSSSPRPTSSTTRESRGAEGANPFHVHEFDFEEFRDELRRSFPHVSLFLENHVEGVTFQPHEAGITVEVRVDSGDAAPDESHFFVAVCAQPPADRAIRRSSTCRAPPTCCASASGTSACSNRSSTRRTAG